MKSIFVGGKEVVEVMGVSIEDLKIAYDDAVDMACCYWEDNCAKIFAGKEYTPLMAYLWVREGEVDCHVEIDFACYYSTSRYAPDWTVVDLLDDEYRPIDATDWVCEKFECGFDEIDESNPAVVAFLEECIHTYHKENPLSFKCFEEVIAELL